MPEIEIMPPELVDEIEAKARAASPGPWEARQDRQCGVLASVTGPSTNPSIPSPDVVCAMHLSDRFIKDDGANAAHIARMDPPTTIAFVTTYRNALARIVELGKDRDALVGALEPLSAYVVQEYVKTGSMTAEDDLRRAARVLEQVRGKA